MKWLLIAIISGTTGVLSSGHLAAAEPTGPPATVQSEVATETAAAPAQDESPAPDSTAVPAKDESPEPDSASLQVDSGAETVLDKKVASRQTVLIASLTIFALAIFVGFEVITKVPPTLHTPLMSGSNAISGITVVGALLAAGSGHSLFGSFLGMVAVSMAMVNVIGGFMVTDRMLGMFRRK